MTDQADALAGLDVFRGCGDHVYQNAHCPHCTNNSAVVDKIAAHFAEEIAKVREELENHRSASLTRLETRDCIIEIRDKTITTLTAENERLKGWIKDHYAHCSQEPDAMTLRGERDDARVALIKAEATLARVRAGLTREKIAEVVIGTFTTTTGTYGPVVTRDQAHHAARLVDAILALIGPEGKG